MTAIIAFVGGGLFEYALRIYEIKNIEWYYLMPYFIIGLDIIITIIAIYFIITFNSLLNEIYGK